LGAEDEINGEPTFGLYNLADFSPVWEKVNMNVQDFVISYNSSKEIISNSWVICGDTDQYLSLFDLRSGDCLFPTEEDKLPTLINSVNIIQIETETNPIWLIVAGCDDGKLYTLQITQKF
jgi:hypothetical protein